MKEILKRFEKEKDSEKAKILQRFFKTGKGEYGEGDIFLGIIVPKQRKISKDFSHLGLDKLEKLLNSKIHEHRLTSLFILIEKYKKSNNKKIEFDFYWRNIKNINNWDLVDLSAPNIIGEFLIDKDRKILFKLLKSKNLWERRIAVLACFSFIRNNDFKDILKISKILLKDKEDLIRKAVGWMLREVGKRNLKVEKEFLEKYYKIMPRTMLRYAIEKFPENERKRYLSKN